MSDALFPIPVETPVSDDPKFGALRFGAIWMRFWKAMSDDMLAAQIVNNLPVSSITSPLPDPAGTTQAQINAAARAFKYTLNANRCEVTYYNEAPLTVPLVVNLPYTAALAFDIDGVMYTPTSSTLIKQITIPANTGYTRFWYVIQTTRN